MQVIENPARHRFELRIDGADEDELALAYYRLDEAGRLVLHHTEVPQRFAGQGIGSALARGTFDLIRASGRKAVLTCPFMAAWYARHPEYADIVAG